MILLVIILGILMIAAFVKVATSDWDGTGWMLTGIALFLGWVVVFLLAAKWQVSSQTLTGYVYQRQDRYGFVSYDLRFSQNAGMDAQPSFCVKAGSEADKKLTEAVGKDDVKVEIFVPSAGFRIANNIFECNSFAEFKGTIK